MNLDKIKIIPTGKLKKKIQKYKAKASKIIAFGMSKTADGETELAHHLYVIDVLQEEKDKRGEFWREYLIQRSAEISHTLIAGVSYYERYKNTKDIKHFPIHSEDEAEQANTIVSRIEAVQMEIRLTDIVDEKDKLAEFLSRLCKFVDNHYRDFLGDIERSHLYV